MKTSRNNGAIGALLDEYERVVFDLLEIVNDISNKELITIVDDRTKDPDCKSIQTILSHVIRAGYGYAIEVRRSFGEQIKFRKEVLLDSVVAYEKALTNMFNYNEELFENNSNIVLEELDNEKKIIVRWGQSYDVEQLFEHAIVHILRHRRQIEGFLVKLRYAERDLCG